MQRDSPPKLRARALAALAPPGVPASLRRAVAMHDRNIAAILKQRERGRAQARVRASHGEHSRRTSDGPDRCWAERESAGKHYSRYFDLPPTTKSTISIAISPDGKTFASTHGDHTVKIICMRTGRLIQTLVGHPRTPWSVKFHPTNPRYLASGCLGFEVRFWDVETGRCLYKWSLRHAIISISFHPSGDILAIASGTCVFTWDYQHSIPRLAMISCQTLRSVTFLPDPTKIIIGEANERYMRSLAQAGQSQQTDLTVTLTLWDFDPSWALALQAPENKVAMTNQREIISHALIYNDGGFDISRCGGYLAICADFSLRQAEKDAEADAANDESLALLPTTFDTTESSILLNNPQIARAIERRTSSLESASSVAESEAAMGDALLELPQSFPSQRDSISFLIAAPRVPRRRLPPLPFTNDLGNASFQTATTSGDATTSMDFYLNQQLRRVRPRLQQIRMARRVRPFRTDTIPDVTPTDRFSATHIRPNIAVSTTHLTRYQRSLRNRLAAQVQSTWLALISLDPRQLGRVVQTCFLEETTAGGVTSVKLSPTSSYVLLGYGVRDRGPRESDFPIHRVTRIYRWEDMKLCSHVESELDDVNIALFSPICGGGFLYGTKQGKLRLCSTYRGAVTDEDNCNMLRAANARRRVQWQVDDDDESSMDDMDPDDDGEEMDEEEEDGSADDGDDDDEAESDGDISSHDESGDENEHDNVGEIDNHNAPPIGQPT